ncbi:helix-turn-helix domain-containing protein [[Pseudomonas] boreopolis]|uniref:helix-turn-helix domain-containing protein n=1 Tax=Xanthomonas boreopolis TaxID=86183 RepID=UPI003DA18FA1
MSNPNRLSAIKENRRQRLALLLQERGRHLVAEKTGLSPSYLYQMSEAKGSSARNVSDETAESIERALGLPAGWLDIQASVSSQPEILDPGRLHSAITFLENLFAAKGKVFAASANTAMIAAVYAELLKSPEANLVEMSVRYGSQIDEGSNERQGQVGSVGSHDRPAARGRARTA